jgi:hypothetical protein
VRRLRLYRTLTVVSLWAAGAAAVLTVVAVVLARPFEATAAALCAAVFFLPALAFLRYWRRLYVRDLALAHAAKIAEEAGVVDAKTLGEKLSVSQADATKILQLAIREGHVEGDVDDRGEFVSASAPRCPKCGKAIPRAQRGGSCSACGTAFPGGG